MRALVRAGRCVCRLPESAAPSSPDRSTYRLVRLPLILFVIVFLAPIAVSAAIYFATQRPIDWRNADRSSAGLLPAAEEHKAAVVRIFAARTVRWRGILATHSWIVMKGSGERSYTRYDYMAWGEPIRVNGFVADGRWFGRVPMLVYAADGDAAQRLIPRMQAAIDGYAWRNYGDYRVWPGPNSNTFVAAVMAAVPEIRATLPPTAIGKDYPWNGRWIDRTPSGTGVRLTLGGYAAITVGWVEGIEINLLGAVAGLDVRRPGIKLPALGRFGV